MTTGGYIGDAPPYQGHVVAIDRASGRIRGVFNSLCSDRHTIFAPSSCASSDSAIWARSGAVVEPRTAAAAGRHRQRALERAHRLGRQRAAAQPRRPPPAGPLDPGQPGSAERRRRGPGLHRTGAAAGRAGAPVRQGRPAAPAQHAAHPGRRRASGDRRGAADPRCPGRRGDVQRSRGVPPRRAHHRLRHHRGGHGGLRRSGAGGCARRGRTERAAPVPWWRAGSSTSRPSTGA